MADSKLIRECGGSGYNEFKSDFQQQYAVLQDIESKCA
jgi:hypothetical protein